MFDWKSAVAKVAPGIANVLGGPLAGMATTAVCEVFGIAPDAPDVDKQLAEAVSKMTPEQALALKQSDNDFAIQMKKIGYDIYKLDIEDRQDARNKHKGSWFVAVLSAVVVAGWIFLTWLMVDSEIGPDKMPLIMRALGTVDAALFAVLYYWVGSSNGSREKDKK